MGDRDGLDVSKTLVRGDYDPATGDGLFSKNPQLGVDGQDVDFRSLCQRDHIGATACFLPDKRRDDLMSIYRTRVLAAQGVYSSALSNLKLEKLLEKDDELSWIVPLVLDVIGLWGLSALGAGLKSLVSESTANLAALVSTKPETAASIARTAHGALSMVTDKHLESVSKVIVDQGKKTATTKARSVHRQGAANKAAISLDYITRLKSDATHVFAQLRERAPIHAADAQLLVMVRGFDDTYHTDAIYSAQLSEKLSRFEAAGMDKIGRTLDWRDVTSPPGDRDESDRDRPSAEHREWMEVVRDRAVVRVTYRDGSPDRYAYAHRDWRVAVETEGLNTEHYPLDQEDARRVRAPARDASPTQREVHGTGLPTWQEEQSSGPELEGLIPREFQDVAIERHLDVWGADPVTVVRDHPPANVNDARNYLPGKPFGRQPDLDPQDARNYAPGKPFGRNPQLDPDDMRNYVPGAPYGDQPDPWDMRNYGPDAAYGVPNSQKGTR